MKIMLLHLARLVATGRTRALIGRLLVAESTQEVYCAAWWVDEIHYTRPESLRNRLARRLALAI